MLIRVLWIGLLLVNGCHKSQNSKLQDFFNKNLEGKDFKLESKELVLTLDDGPGPGTAEIVAFLKKRNVPATFFMIGKHAKLPEYKEVNKEIAASPLFLVGNHSMNHSKALTTGSGWAISEIRSADKILRPLMEKQKLSFMRPPYGALIGNASLIKAINNADDGNGGRLKKYIGPVFWDIGGGMKNGYAADWACWSQKLSASNCRNRYIKEVEARGKGIILAHDYHKNTAEMLIGDGKSTGMIDRLLAKGYKFVPLNKAGDEVLATEFNSAGTGAEEADLDQFSLQLNNDSLTVDVSARGMAKFALFLDGELLQVVNGSTAQFKVNDLTSGNYKISVAGYANADDKEPTIFKQVLERVGSH